MKVYEFFVNYGFILEFLIATALFVFSLRRRKLFLLRLILPVSLLSGIAFLWNTLIPYSVISQIFIWTLYFLIMAGGVLFCFDVNFGAAVFCGIGAYATQHLAFKTGDILRTALSGASEFLSSAVYVAAVGVVFVISYFAFARRIRKNEEAYIKNVQILLLSLALIIFTNITQAVFTEYGGGIGMPLFLTFAACDLLCSIFTLCIQYGMFESGKMIREFKVMEHILHQQKIQMESSKKNIELINIKCHDLKHQISLFGDKLTAGELGDLEKAVSIYDSTLKTGNDTLDIVLTEKSLLCEKNKIKLDCMADGKQLSFMGPSDIYSLFGNALDNAVEAVQAIEDTDKRLISICVKENFGILSVHFSNNYSGGFVLDNGLPVTTKSDKEYHGFGLKSVRMIVEKYKGNLTIVADNGIFNLNILFPIPQQGV